MNSIGEKIRLKRLERNYSQENMAFDLDISQAAYSKIERGETEISVPRIFAIAEILKCSPYEFMPKPKYGTGLAMDYVYRTISRLGRFYRRLKNGSGSISPGARESNKPLQ